ncbi:class I SAM-dependent methyltransferase [Jannaschia sp. KMU-145]|uniref:class I SAM-dependent methyltransferase n=1 Tax=Jannaschia halovivens TaxID=3388667 RepID=UPI00396B2830
MTTDDRSSREDALGRLAMYRELQRAVPGLETIYRLGAALVAGGPSPAPRVLVVGAGGGREIETIRTAVPDAAMTAVDPSPDNLALARRIAGDVDKIQFVEGRVEELETDASFDVATSFLVMHHLPDDGAKLAYLAAIRDRLAAGGSLLHADICVEDATAFETLVPLCEAHARHIGARAEAVQLELRTVPTLPVVSPDRMGSLFVQAGLTPPQEVFRSLWYRCWISGRPLDISKEQAA